MEKPTTERTWNVIPCFIKCLKEDRQRHSEEHSLSSQIWEAATFGYCNGRQDYIPTSAPAAQGGLPESNTNLQVRIKNSELDWLMLPPFENELTLTEELRQASDQWTHILLMHKKKIIFFIKQRDCLARQPSLVEKHQTLPSQPEELVMQALNTVGGSRDFPLKWTVEY